MSGRRADTPRGSRRSLVVALVAVLLVVVAAALVGMQMAEVGL